MYGIKFHRSKLPIGNNENLIFDDGTRISVYFLPENNATDNGIIPLITSAKNYIHISIFYLTHPKIVDALIGAHNRGVQIKIIVDATSASNPYSKHEDLRQAGIPVKVENWGGKMHMKSMVVDDKYSVIGSMNWTTSAQKNNDENTIIIENSEIAGKMEDNFLYLWNAIPDKWLRGRPLPESPDSIGSCFDGMDNDHDGFTDSKDPDCKVYDKHTFNFFKRRSIDDGAE